MVSATSSRGRKRPLSIQALRAPIERALAHGPVPFLVLRVPRRFEREMTLAFQNAARRVLRFGDLSAHDPGSEAFVVAMIAPSRDSCAPAAASCRAVLERLAAAMTITSEVRVESGWTLIRAFETPDGLQREIEIALERGARDRERFEFFAAIGHELRTPLTSIRGYLETLLDGDVEPAVARRFMETARREALRMARLLDGMFEFSLLDLSADPMRGVCEVAQQIELACEVVRPAAEARSIAVRQGPCARTTVALDSDVLLQLLVNLLDNAIKYGRDSGAVCIGAEMRSGDLVIAVDDDGPGIAPGERDSIFGLRVRGAQAASRPGTGIGLAIVKTIAERAGGFVRVVESPMGGARFEALLPAAKAESAEGAS